MRTALFLFLAATTLAAQDRRKKDDGRPKVDQAAVDEAIRKGVAYLKSRIPELTPRVDGAKCADELILWTFVYYLYALERAGVLYGTETFGAHEWYVEGAQTLLKGQNPDGSWGSDKLSRAGETCFAVLFLRRATRPLVDVASEDRYRGK